MKFGASPQKQPLRSHEPNHQQMHSGEGSDSAWQALQQAARTKPRSGFLPNRSAPQQTLPPSKMGM